MGKAFLRRYIGNDVGNLVSPVDVDKIQRMLSQIFLDEV